MQSIASTAKTTATMTETATATATVTATEDALIHIGLSFSAADYALFIVLLATSATIGVYFGCFSKSKNTTDEYLMGGKKLQIIPVAVSLVASQLSGIAIMSVPADSYAYGIGYMFICTSIVLVVPLLNFIVVPVFYKNNISNCYEYLELRFDRRTRQLVTATFIMNGFLMLPVYMFIPALAFAQVTGINIHLINAIVSSICVTYTMLGGIKAVVWTDVVQGAIMLCSVSMVAILGTLKVGGLTAVLSAADASERLKIDFSLDPRIRMNFWTGIVSGTIMWTSHIGLNQSCVQRIVSLPTLAHAKRSILIAGFGFFLIMGLNSFTGIIMYARYDGCDPIAAGLVNKLDKMMPFFVQDIVGHITGMPGVFISCVFSAALSTLSATLNSMTGVIYFDYIRPFIRHTEQRANAIMKLFVIAMGLYCIAGGFVVQSLDSILQTIITIIGINSGAVFGVFLLGMFVPRANAKVAMTSIIFSVLVMLWIIVHAQFNIKNGLINYAPLPNGLEQCAAKGFDFNSHNNTTIASTMQPDLVETTPTPVTTAFASNRAFSIYDISFFWYKTLGALLVFICAVPMSFICKTDDLASKADPKLFSPLIRNWLNFEETEMKDLSVVMPLNTNENYLFANESKIRISK